MPILGTLDSAVLFAFVAHWAGAGPANCTRSWPLGALRSRNQNETAKRGQKWNETDKNRQKQTKTDKTDKTEKTDKTDETDN